MIKIYLYLNLKFCHYLYQHFTKKQSIDQDKKYNIFYSNITVAFAFDFYLIVLNKSVMAPVFNDIQ